METNGIQNHVGWNINRSWKKFLMPLGALLLGWLVVTSWLTGLAGTQESYSDISKQEKQPLAPNSFGFIITKSQFPNDAFTINTTGQRYNIFVEVVTDTTSAPASPEIFDRLPDGMTIDTFEGNNWTCNFINQPEINCTYDEPITEIGTLPVLRIFVNVNRIRSCIVLLLLRLSV